MDSRNTEQTPVSNRKSRSSLYKYLKQLSDDLKTLYENSYDCDFELKLPIGGHSIPCHRAILTTRSPWFALKIEERCEKDSKCLKLRNGDYEMIRVLLLYIYTGNLVLIENFNIPTMDLLEIAETYYVTRLKKLLITSLKFDQKSTVVTTQRLHWKVDYDNTRVISSDFEPICESTVRGNYTWSFSCRTVVQKGDTDTFAEIFLARKSNDNPEVIHAVELHLRILDANRRDAFETRKIHIFRTDCKKKVISCKVIDLPSTAHFRNLLLKGGKILMAGSLALISESKVDRCIFKLRGIQKRHRRRELMLLSYDMRIILKSQKYTDMTVTDVYTKSQFLHSYIIFARTSLTREDFHKINNIRKNESIAWFSFVSFVYSGQIRFLDDHMRMMYALAIEHNFSKLRDMYSDILVKCATKENIIRIAEDAFVYNDLLLMASGLYIKLHELGEIDKPEFVLKNTLEWKNFIFNIEEQLGAMKMVDRSCTVEK